MLRLLRVSPRLSAAACRAAQADAPIQQASCSPIRRDHRESSRRTIGPVIDALAQFRPARRADRPFWNAGRPRDVAREADGLFFYARGDRPRHAAHLRYRHRGRDRRVPEDDFDQLKPNGGVRAHDRHGAGAVPAVRPGPRRAAPPWTPSRAGPDPARSQPCARRSTETRPGAAARKERLERLLTRASAKRRGPDRGHQELRRRSER